MTMAMEGILHTLRRTGRPRKSSRRMAGNRSPRETVAGIVSVAKAYRIKAGIDPEDALNSLHGTTLGTLHRNWQIWKGDPMGISDAQYNAGQRYLGFVISHARLRGIPSPHPRSAALLMAGMGISCMAEPDQGEVDRILGKFRDCRAVLLDAGKELGIGSAINRVVYGVVVENWEISRIKAPEVQNLRCGLNALARVLG